jgi:hypothetical protein
MQILTLDNKRFSLNNLPDEVDDTARFAVLDNSDPKNPDFFFVPLIFLESFNSPAIELKIGSDVIIMPVDWSIIVGDGESGIDAEVLPLTSINDRGFNALIFNPLSSFKIDFKPVEIVNFYNDVKWFFPKMRINHMLATPLSDDAKPDCAYFTKDVSRQCELVDISKLL